MKCVVCDNEIRIDTLKQLFSLDPLLLCNRCAQYLIPKSADVLYDDNEWIRSVIDRLNQGDIVLIKLFKNQLQKALLKKGAINSKIKIIEAKQDLPYPWLEILIDSIMTDLKRDINNTTPSAELIVVAVEKQKNADRQIVIVG